MIIIFRYGHKPCNNEGISYIIIPPGMTHYCQPLYVAVNNSFKDNIKLLFEKIDYSLII